MSERGELIMPGMEVAVMPDTEIEAELVDDSKISKDGLEIAARREGLDPKTATWSSVMRARGLREVPNPEHDEALREYNRQRALEEGLGPNASRKETDDAIKQRLSRNALHIEADGTVTRDGITYSEQEYYDTFHPENEAGDGPAPEQVAA